MNHLHHFCTLVNTHLGYYIFWPVGEALHSSDLGFARAGFPHTVCAVDGCHIPIRKPHVANPVGYFNRKKFYSVILTGFCTSNRRFCHITVGHPGSWHDARAFRLTPAAQTLDLDPLSIVPAGMHIIGDSAYVLLPQLMKPYRDNGHLTARQKRFNRKLNSARVCIEHTFGILEAKFWRLQYLQMSSIERITSAVSACCILHNICIDPQDHTEHPTEPEMNQEPHPPQPNDAQACNYHDNICNNL
ncbi:hypothetical protein ACEWY4_025495 [Coilia grayii]|uniref:DDE Tnp4 domain-containing protein n=1 Tax=Coilia grayii TaxID=363190 RepID=A0ABD1IXV8_9TELE